MKMTRAVCYRCMWGAGSKFMEASRRISELDYLADSGGVNIFYGLPLKIHLVIFFIELQIPCRNSNNKIKTELLTNFDKKKCQ